jgi:hypothetical protein
MRRFLPRHFDEQGFPTDEMGCTCRDLACPYCRHQLPLDLFRLPFHIVSLVGIQRSGKSYYLAILARILSQIMAREFAVRWEDLDPTGNIPLNDLRNRLFAAADAEGAALEKTALGGVMYTEVHRAGRVVAMPRPFTYRVTHPSGPQAAFVFYDNAGEHFTPQVSSDQNPGAMHVSKAAGIMFLYDPLGNPVIKERLRDLGVEDPQIDSDFADYQAVILAEMKTRIARMRNLGPDAQLDVPLAFLVGKHDAWADIFEDPSTQPRAVVREGKFDLEAVEENSWQARTFLNHFCPSVVQNAEALAPNIKYFPISAFGHTPVPTAKGFAPDPRRIKPRLVEAPILWLLHQIRPELVPVI